MGLILFFIYSCLLFISYKFYYYFVVCGTIITNNNAADVDLGYEGPDSLSVRGDAVLLPQAPGGLLSLHMAGYEIAALAVGEEMDEASLAADLLRAVEGVDHVEVLADARELVEARDLDRLIAYFKAMSERKHDPNVGKADAH